MKASNNPVPEWMLKLPKPSKMKRRALKRKPVARKDVGVVAGRAVGKGDAIRRKDMIAASKRRKMAADKPEPEGGNSDGAESS